MSKYIKNNLMNGETIIEQAMEAPVLKKFRVVVMIISIITIVGIPIFFFFFFINLAEKKTERVLTNKRVIVKTGIIGVKTEEMRLEKVENVEIRQGILGRMLNYGNVVVTGAINKVTYGGIENPNKFKTLVNNTIDK